MLVIISVGNKMLSYWTLWSGDHICWSETPGLLQRNGGLLSRQKEIVESDFNKILQKEKKEKRSQLSHTIVIFCSFTGE